MIVMTLRLSDEDEAVLDWLAKHRQPEKLRGLPYTEVIRIALRNDKSRMEKENDQTR
jgi:hypothetical protein